MDVLLNNSKFKREVRIYPNIYKKYRINFLNIGQVIIIRKMLLDSFLIFFMKYFIVLLLALTYINTYAQKSYTASNGIIYKKGVIVTFGKPSEKGIKVTETTETKKVTANTNSHQLQGKKNKTSETKTINKYKFVSNRAALNWYILAGSATDAEPDIYHLPNLEGRKAVIKKVEYTKLYGIKIPCFKTKGGIYVVIEDALKAGELLK